MKVSREQVAENRARILGAAGRLFRERGFADVSVAEVMGAAGLTHGGFYNHFKSKDDLIACTLEHALADSAAVGAGLDLAAYADAYLSPAYCADRAGGCPTAALAGEAALQTAAAREVMTASMRRQIERFTISAPGATQAEKRDAAIGAWAAMVGAVVLARAVDDPKLADEMLAGTRRWLDR